MNILLYQSAKNALKNKKIPLNFAGIFFENGKYCWWYHDFNGIFDTGEESSLKCCFSTLKKLK
jgi:hypothetical protein